MSKVSDSRIAFGQPKRSITQKMYSQHKNYKQREGDFKGREVDDGPGILSADYS